MKQYIALFACLLLFFVMPAASVYSADSAVEYEALFKETLEKAKNDDVTSQYLLGHLYLQGKGVKKDVESGLKWTISAAEKNKFAAQVNLIEIYSQGIGIPKDEKESQKWISIITDHADKGNAEAQYRLGLMIKEGENVPQNLPETIRLFTLSANSNFTQAQYALGEMYDEEKVVPQNYTEAIKWYRLAAENGYNKPVSYDGDDLAIRAGIRLYVMYSTGIGVKKDTKEADKWISLISKQGKTKSLSSEADYALKNITPQLAIKLYRIAAERGDAEAQNKLGDIFKQGRGVPQNFNEAIKWYRSSAKQGDSSALYELGNMYRKGEGVSKNLKESVRYLEKAIQQHKSKIANNTDNYMSSLILGQIRSLQALIGFIYGQGGSGLAKDYVKAYAWFSVATTNGNETTKEHMEAIASKMNHSQIEKAQKLATELWGK
ncbi:MAG: SEL1-like repeat protein [Chlorobium sp.]